MMPITGFPHLLPQENETWEGEFLNLGDDEHPFWIVWITFPDDDFILAHNTYEEMPGADCLWETFLKATEFSYLQQPHRPTRLHVQAEQYDRWKPLRTRLKAAEVQLVACDELLPVDGVPELFDEVWLVWKQKYGKEE